MATFSSRPDGGGDRQEQRALGAGRQDHLLRPAKRRTGEGRKPFGDRLADLLLAAILGVGLPRAVTHAIAERLERTRRRLERVDIAVGEVDRTPGKLLPRHDVIQARRLLAHFLAGGVVGLEGFEFFRDRGHGTLLF